MTMWMYLLACGASETTTTSPEPAPVEATAEAVEQGSWSTIQVADLAAMDPRPFVLDVRTAEEFAGGHVPGAVNIPVQELEGRLSEIEAQREGMAVICASGGRSRAASELLASKGFREVKNVDGGTSGWVAAGHPVE